jgi:hypothetical protein
MGEKQSLFTASFNRSVSVEARPERLTGDAGAILLREVLERSRIIDWMDRRLVDQRDPNQVTYPLSVLLRTAIILQAQGWGDQDDADALRFDAALRLAVSDRRGDGALAAESHLPSQPTLSRLIGGMSEANNRRVLRQGLGEFTGRRIRSMNGGRRRPRLSIDIDSLPIEVHGEQAKSEWNGHYHQRMFHPLVASIGETGDMLDAVLRPGNAHTAEGALEFGLDVVDRAEGRQADGSRLPEAGLCDVALVRMDAGFPCEPTLAGLEQRGIPYIARVRNNAVLDRMAQPYLTRPAGRPPLEPRIWFHEAAYQAKSWSCPRRVVCVVLEKPDELLLNHFWLITNMEAADKPAEVLLPLYRERGKAEGHMGEFMDVLAPALSSAARSKSNYRGRNMISWPNTCDAFARNEAILLMNLLAYQVAHAGRCLMEKATDDGWSLRRFRERLLKAAARVLLHGRRVTVVIAETAAKYWNALWPSLEGAAWPPA